ncbi:MAG: response regulator transcription factor [Nitrospira sp.]|nr:response regulator transcription factor [Nitrospira sp.]
MPTHRPETIRVLLVDDHEIVRVGLRSVLGHKHGIAVVGESASMAEAVALAGKLTPDVILMDIRLPDGSGIDACREILAVLPDTRVLFLTSYADDDSVLAAVLAGARGYILKEIDSSSLTRAIHAVAEGRSILDPAVTDRALRWVRGFATGNDRPDEKLSVQEERVLALVADGKTNKEIAAEMGLSDKTVKNYLATVFQKLRITRRVQAAAFFVKRQA